jgi:hypothetical protein
MSRIARVVALVLALGLVTVACGDGDNGGFSDEIRAEFMDGCAADGGVAFCECTLNELEKTLSEAEFIQIGLSAFTDGSEEPPEEIMAAVLACIDEIDIGE